MRKVTKAAIRSINETLQGRIVERETIFHLSHFLSGGTRLQSFTKPPVRFAEKAGGR